MGKRPLIVFTNDDGIESPGLWATVKAFEGFGDLLVVAPRLQQSGMGRSMPASNEGRIYPYKDKPAIKNCKAYSVDASPAQAVQHAILELATQKPQLLISGINYGENVGNGITISGTVGAALEAASFDVPAIAISQQMHTNLHTSYSTEVDFIGTAFFARLFGEWLVRSWSQLEDIDVLKIDTPENTTPQTPWRMTRISRQRIFWPTQPKRKSLDDIGKLGYRFDAIPSEAEPDSDVYAVLHDQVVSVSPMSLDMSSRTDMFRLWQTIVEQTTVKVS